MSETNEKPFIKPAAFLTSAANEKQFLKPEKPVIAVCGKSNVGKSSFINFLAGQKKLAKTSRAPGRTRLVNYFDFGAFVLADLPGYGFAEVSKAEKDRWAKTLDKFFAQEGIKMHVFLLVDCRHDPTENDLTMMEFLNYHVLPFTVVLTKADKLSKMKLKEHISLIAADLKLGKENLLATSAETGYGKTEILKKISEIVEVFNAAETAEGEEE